MIALLASGILGLTCCHQPALPVFDRGAPLFNVGQGIAEADANASAHLAWAIAVPLVGERIGGRKGKWIAGLSWIAFTLLTETFLHAPAQYGSSYASEVRTDLASRLGPTMLILSFDLLTH